VSECDALVQKAATKVVPVTTSDPLQLTVDPSFFVKTERVMLWQGMLKGPAAKAVEERIEQVTGFPASHYSDWTVDRLTTGSYWKPHYDTLPGNYVPLATITVFLSETADAGGEIVFPSTNTDPVKIRPVKGMAVVHHNTNDKHEFEVKALYALLPVTTESFYIARKYILPAPVSNARRIGLPVLAAATGGKLPGFVVRLHDWLTAQYGVVTGGLYFDKLVVFLPVLLMLGLAQYIGQAVHKQMKGSGKAKSPATTAHAATSKKASKKKN
jgi:2OG-Fe(II) oxygenase superfamily